ncbi:hypothetical protein [Pseudaminobacter salicylatoxidans]|uniref:hypothetical protein n=1 Tax=Pseudaminobacter salicylatoxidans TaxID=93369 RepID=UPI0002D97AB5|nr:hypothetical protein [Pseudaminobacter salicylatoxidans]
MIDPRVKALCDEFGVTIVPKHSYPRPGETRAVGTIRKMIERRGMEHARIVLSTLTETANNKASLEAECIGAASDLLLACQHYQEEDPEKWFQVWDKTPVGELQAVARDLRGFAPLRAVLAGLIYERIWRAYGPRAFQPDFLDDRMLNP